MRAPDIKRRGVWSRNRNRSGKKKWKNERKEVKDYREVADSKTKNIHKTRYCTAEGEILGMESLSVRVGGNWILDIWMD